ncbi:MAG: hypothetical protein Q8R79_07485, partial [Legionellaceae bacterium]|nr:hypothetical protein [Legionellaceae bacterium]
FYYAASFASLMMLTSNGVSIFTRLGFQPTTAIYNTAWVLGLSTSVRTYLPFLTLPIRPAEITSLSFFAMALLSYAISITSDKYLQGLFIFILFPIFNGAVNFSVPREALEVVSENKQGLLTGFYTAAAGVAPLLALLTPYLASLQEKAGHKSMLPEYTVVSFISALAFSISVFQYCCAHTKRHEKNVTQALLKHALHKPIPNYGTAPSQNDGKIIINAAPL